MKKMLKKEGKEETETLCKYIKKSMQVSRYILICSVYFLISMMTPLKSSKREIIKPKSTGQATVNDDSLEIQREV